MVTQRENNPAVVTPLDEHMGLDIARSLGQQGIQVYGIDPDSEAAGRSSKYCQLVLSPDPIGAEHDYVEFLLQWGKKQASKTVLFPVSDETVQICSRHRHLLHPYYEFVMPEHKVISTVASKQGLAETATLFKVPAPQSFFLKDIAEVQQVVPFLPYPVILKPSESKYWHTPEIAAYLRKQALSGRVKVVECHSPAELLEYYQKLSTYDNRMIIQEMIPGPDENLAYISFYLDRQSRPLAVFAGRKIRVLPIHCGSASYVQSFYDPALEHVAMQLLSNIKYQGLGGIEFKLDERDGQYKLIEFNPRFGMWDGLGVRCGVDTPFIAYQDALGRLVQPQRTYRKGVIWVDWQRDVRAFWMYRQQGYLTLNQWLKSLRGEKMWAIYSRDDWRPGVRFSLNLVREFWVRLIKRSRPQSLSG